MTFAETRTYGVPDFAGTEVNRHSGKLKGLSGYLQNHYPTPAPLQPHNTPQYHHDTMVGDKTQQTSKIITNCFLLKMIIIFTSLSQCDHK